MLLSAYRLFILLTVNMLAYYLLGFLWLHCREQVHSWTEFVPQKANDTLYCLEVKKSCFEKLKFTLTYTCHKHTCHACYIMDFSEYQSHMRAYLEPLHVCAGVEKLYCVVSY